MALSPCGWGNWPCARGETCTANINTIGFKNPERDVAEYSSPRFMAANRERWWKHINQYHFCWKNQPNADRSTKRHFDKLIIVSSKKTLMNKIMIIPTSSKSVKFGGTKWNGATRPTNYRDGGAKFEQILPCFPSYFLLLLLLLPSPLSLSLSLSLSVFLSCNLSRSIMQHG